MTWPDHRLAWRAVATSNTGGWVRRVGSSGGGRTYRRRRPVNFYGIIGVVVVLGLFSVSLARYDYRRKPPTAQAVQPTKGTSWFAAVGLDVCGKRLPSLAADPNTVPTTGFEVLKSGELWIFPPSDALGGTNATVGAFAASYPHLVVSDSELSIPLRHLAAKLRTLKTGEACPAGTPDAGKVGHVEVATWANQYAPADHPKVSTNPFSVRFTGDNMLVTLAFVPTGQVPLRPTQNQINAIDTGPDETTSTTTTTTLPATSTSTTAPHRSKH